MKFWHLDGPITFLDTSKLESYDSNIKPIKDSVREILIQMKKNKDDDDDSLPLPTSEHVFKAHN